MIVLQIAAIVAGFCIIVGPLWGYMDMVWRDGLDPASVTMFPIIMLAVGAGFLLFSGAITGFR